MTERSWAPRATQITATPIVIQSRPLHGVVARSGLGANGRYLVDVEVPTPGHRPMLYQVQVDRQQLLNYPPGQRVTLRWELSPEVEA